MKLKTRIPQYPTSSFTWDQKLKESIVFNCLPRHGTDIKDIDVERFKSALNIWLRTVPDDPHISDYTPQEEQRIIPLKKCVTGQQTIMALRSRLANSNKGRR